MHDLATEILLFRSSILEDNQVERVPIDGLSDLKYRLDRIERAEHYRKLLIDIRRLEIEHIDVFIDDHKEETFTDKKGEF